MSVFKTKVLWSQIDPNLHLRHSAYADIAASARLELLDVGGFSLEMLAHEKFGPILFKEELVYYKEILGVQELTVKTYLKKVERAFSKWSMVSEIYREDGELSCVVTVEGAWIDLKIRKVASLPEKFRVAFMEVPKTNDFELND
ncbi:MAG TPA: thioesterase family protein [Crocinitomicaceae bacterium]|nr:thioesterase family protein [Crocinitomicaceae bacterium]